MCVCVCVSVCQCVRACIWTYSVNYHRIDDTTSFC